MLTHVPSIGTLDGTSAADRPRGRGPADRPRGRGAATDRRPAMAFGEDGRVRDLGGAVIGAGPWVREWQRRTDRRSRRAYLIHGRWHLARGAEPRPRPTIRTICGWRIADYSPLAGFEQAAESPTDALCGRCRRVWGDRPDA